LVSSQRAPEPFVVELAANAKPAVLAAVEAAIGAVAPLATVELVRVDAMTLSKGDMIRLRSPSIAWNAPASVWRRHDRVLVAFAAAFDANLAAASDRGGGS
jgi:hypothetical protein